MTKEEEKRIFQTIANAQLDYYVYALCNHNIPFYIGKGNGKRVLQHLEEANVKESMLNGSQEDMKLSDKIKRIIAEKESVECVIIKWGLSEHEAFMCESALINLLNFSQGVKIDKLTNEVNGHASEAEKISRAEIKTKARTLKQFLNECAIQTKDVSEIPANVAFIKINTLYDKCLNKNDNSADKEKVKDAARAMWSIAAEKSKQIQYIFALYQQRVVGIFNVERISERV